MPQCIPCPGSGAIEHIRANGERLRLNAGTGVLHRSPVLQFANVAHAAYSARPLLLERLRMPCRRPFALMMISRTLTSVRS